ncbi:hypothetical protein EJB05_13835, partial [Eragrostis curvula]
MDSIFRPSVQPHLWEAPDPNRKVEDKVEGDAGLSVLRRGSDDLGGSVLCAPTACAVDEGHMRGDMGAPMLESRTGFANPVEGKTEPMFGGIRGAGEPARLGSAGASMSMESSPPDSSSLESSMETMSASAEMSRDPLFKAT